MHTFVPSMISPSIFRQTQKNIFTKPNNHRNRRIAQTITPMKKILLSLACAFLSISLTAQNSSESTKTKVIDHFYFMGGGAVAFTNNTSLLGGQLGAHVWFSERHGFAVHALRTDEKFFNYSLNFEDKPEHRVTTIEDLSFLYLRGTQWRNAKVFAGIGVSVGTYNYRGNKYIQEQSNGGIIFPFTRYDMQKHDYFGLPVCVGLNTGSNLAGFQLQFYANLRSRMDAGVRMSLLLGKLK